MKTNYLLPNKLKKFGWVFFIIGFALWILSMIFTSEPDFLNFKVFAISDTFIFSDELFFEMTENNVFDEIIGLLLIFGSIFIALSKEKSEDEFISKIRLESLVWATYINYAILVLAILFIFGFSFFTVLVYNMFTLLIFFLIRFNWMIYKLKKSVKNEE